MSNNDIEIADFRRFRFFRDVHENIVSVSAQVFGEKLFPVVDGRDFRLARLHVHEQAARKRDWLETFEREMVLLAGLKDRFVSLPIEWGRDDDELFYVNDFRDGEDLPTYLSRVGSLAPQIAARWLLPFVEMIEGREECPLSLLRIHNPNFQVVGNPETSQAELHLTEFTEWTKPGNLVVEHGADYFLAQSFLSLISGIPIREFTEESLPRQFQDLSEDFQAVVLGSLQGQGETVPAFFEWIHKLADEAKHFSTHPPLPHSSFRVWMRSQIKQLPNAAKFAVLEESEDNTERHFSTEGEYEGLAVLNQFIPGTSTIPKEGWFAQHWQALRRPGKNFANQLAVFHVEESSAVYMIVEERPNGIHLGQLIREMGPLDLDHTVAIAKRLSSALDGLESNVNATPVWWLPASNVFLNTGTTHLPDFREAIEYEGSDFWERVPFRLRLHQTFRDLQNGIVLPESIQSMAEKLTKESPHIRRTAVLMPLVGFLLSGKKFDWNLPFETENKVPKDVIEFINATRTIMVDYPLRLKMGFLKGLENFLEEWDHETYAEEAGIEVSATHPSNVRETGIEVEITSGAEEVAPAAPLKDSELKEFLHHKLGDDKIDLAQPATETVLLSPLDPGYVPPELVTGGDPNDPFKGPYLEGHSFNPIAADLAQKNREERAEQRIAQRQRAAEKQNERRKAAREILGLDKKQESTPSRNKFGIIGWIAGGVFALVLGGIVTYLAHGKATLEGTVQVELDSFPRSDYQKVTPQVNPFTDIAGSLSSQKSRRALQISAEVSDFATAVAKSKLSVDQQKFAAAVNLALLAVQLKPESVEAGAQVDSSLQAWIESGIDIPSRTEDPVAVQVLAEYYLTDDSKPVVDGLYLLMAAAMKQNAVAMRVYGLLFGQGNLVPRSPSIGERWLRSAAEKGDLDAQFYYGESAASGEMILPVEGVFHYIEKAAAAGHPRALLFRGYCYIEGVAGEKDEARGFQLISRAAEKNSIEAIHHRGLCLANGIGTARNERSAALAFRAAADLGHSPAMYHYAQCLMAGSGLAKNYPDGVSWMKKAASAGYLAAQNWCARHGESY